MLCGDLAGGRNIFPFCTVYASTGLLSPAKYTRWLFGSALYPECEGESTVLAGQSRAMIHRHSVLRKAWTHHFLSDRRADRQQLLRIDFPARLCRNTPFYFFAAPGRMRPGLHGCCLRRCPDWRVGAFHTNLRLHRKGGGL